MSDNSQRFFRLRNGVVGSVADRASAISSSMPSGNFLTHRGCNVPAGHRSSVFFLEIEMSVFSFPERGPWGDAKWRGNCTGYVYKALFEQLQPKVFCDPMMGSGTSVQVAREMGIEAYGLDLHQGHNILRDSIVNAIGKQVDLCLSHPPYGDVVIYSGEVWGQPHPDDLSRCSSEADFHEKLHIALLNQREATLPGGFYGTIIGDKRKAGSYISYQAEAIARMPANELASVMIKHQHNVMSSSRSYRGMRLPRITHEFIILWQKPQAITSFLSDIAIMALQQSKRVGSTWKAVVRNVLIRLGGAAPLAKIYEAVAQNAPERLAANPNWDAKVRQVLNQNRDIFASTERGIWSLAG